MISNSSIPNVSNPMSERHGPPHDRRFTDANGAASRPAYTTRILTSVGDLEHADAVALFGDGVDGARHLRALEATERGATGYPTAMIAVCRGPTVVAAAPVFRIEHRLDMALGQRGRAVGDIVHKIAPRLISLPVLCLGTRSSEECPIGFRSELTGHERAGVFKVLLDGLAHHASSTGIKLISAVNFADRDTGWGHGTLEAAGFTPIPAPPIATLELAFEDEAGYLASLSANMRKDLKRKLKSFAKVEIEIRHSIDGIEAEIVELYEATKARCKTDFGGFDDVPASYFREVVGALRDRCVIVLIRVDGALASFSLSIVDGDRMVGKYVGMRYPLGVEHDVYFLNWMTCVRYCLKHRIRWLQVGQSSYRQKVRLGCQLKRSWAYFRHTGAILGPLLRAIGPHFGFDAMEPELAALGDKAPYLSAEAETGRALSKHE